ncbi:MAG: anaerobic ribonucleoside-triphosphate reductase [Anaerolineae bacterium]|nr:anaerobic ribonucleoside-triphosphate reductase [Anaerolineae bacterium]
MMEQVLDINADQAEETELRVPCEVYSRVVGYLRPVQNWHQGKKQEFADRKAFRVEETLQKESQTNQ